MNCGVFLLLLALVSATPLHNNPKDIRIDDEGTITVSTENGRVLFSQAHENHEHLVIIAKIAHEPSRKIEINNENQVVKNVTHWTDNQTHHANKDEHSGTTNSQLAVLKNIFRQHQGVVDDATFAQVMAEVKQAAERGQVHMAVYNVLKQLAPHHSYINVPSWEKQKTFPLVSKDTFSHHPYEHRHYSHYGSENDYTYGTHHYSYPQSYSDNQYHHGLETAVDPYPALNAFFGGYGFLGDSNAQFSAKFPKYAGHQHHKWTADQIHELVSQLHHEEQEVSHFLRREHHINQQLQYLLALQSSSHYHSMSHGQQEGILHEQKSLVSEQEVMLQQHLVHQQQIQRLHKEIEAQLDYLNHKDVESNYY
ncbi:sex-determining region Y protein-like [Cylas formicarius]|uniref:sex-determining region Y protein-like n=1 Tax=Cylas formicarius TaxID=197179 RepID=UPI00295874C2|nr:sex-determining region Y protein-like [Cylas formicarius]